jgi:hypothetical protein
MKKLEELFDLPPSSNNRIDESAPVVTPDKEMLQVLDDTIDKVEAALPQVRGLELADKEFDDLAKIAVDGHNELFTLGMQVDSRFASEIFSVASNMLGHAITAKTAKLDKKLKMIDLQLKKMRLDQTAKPEGEDGTGPMQTAQGVVLSRNDLLDRIVGRKDQNDQKE